MPAGLQLNPRWLCLLGLTALAGCGVAVSPKGARLPLPTATSFIRPQPTAVPPTPTAEPTPAPTATAEPTAAPAAEPVPAGGTARLPVAQPPAAVFPCPPPRTPARPGYLATNGAGPVFRPIVVQIDNAIPARPALNLSHAHTVFESVAEGGVTRFSAIYTAEDPGFVGPVRSARLVSIEVARQFEAILAYHGASTGVQDRIWNGGIYFMSFNAPDSAPFHSRLNNRAVPHNSIVRLPDVRRYGTAKGASPRVDDWPDYPRGDVLAPPSGPASRLSVGFAGPTGAPWPDYRADFRFVPETGLYLRSTAGRPDVDGATNEPISARTVVVQIAPVVVTDIVEDVFGSLSLDYQLHGEGKALYFRDGHFWEGCWRRDNPFAPTTFIGPDSQVFPFAKGPLWIAVTSPNTPVSRDA